jgi:hypothetical protein
VKNANTLAHGGVHLVVLAHLQRRQCLRGEVWRLPLLPAELARQDLVKNRQRTEVIGVTGRWPQQDLTLPSTSGQWQQQIVPNARVLHRCVWSVMGPARPVKHPVEQRSKQGRSDTVVHPVICHRTCSIDKNPLW